MRCTEAQPLLALYVDGAVTGGEMQSIAEHLRQCAACASECNGHENTRKWVSSLGRKQVPPDLALRIRISVSHARSRKFLHRLQNYGLRLRDAFNAIMFPATAGTLTAVIFFGILIGSFNLAQGRADNEIPTALYTPPRWEPPQSQMSSYADTELNLDAPIVVKAFVDANGKVLSYEIISGRDDSEARSKLNRALLFTNFAPAYAFGQPVSSIAVICFSHVNVKG